MSAAETAPFNEQTGFMELVSEPAGSKANPSQISSDATPVAAFRRRQISPQTGRALEILGHAIEYLADQFAVETGILSPIQEPQEQALQILMAANRSVYLACPTVPTLRERFRDLWRVPRLLLHR
jgi:hypothetical protein